MSGKIYSVQVSETQNQHIIAEAERLKKSTSVVLRELVETGINGKEMNEQLEAIKKLTIEQQGLFQKQTNFLISNLGSVRFEVKMLYIQKFGEKRAHELRVLADEIGQKKLLEIKS